MAYGKKYVYSDKQRGVPVQKETYQKHGVKPMDKAYQAPSTKYTNGQMKDTKQPPPKKPKQTYGKKGGVTVAMGNKNAPIKSVADIRDRRKKMFGF